MAECACEGRLSYYQGSIACALAWISDMIDRQGEWQQWRDVRAVGVPCGSVLTQGQYTASCEACDGSRGRKGWTVCYDSASCSSPISKVKNEEEAGTLWQRRLG
jgi:hypothetical protein